MTRNPQIQVTIKIFYWDHGLLFNSDKYVTTSLWRQDVSLFVRLSCKHEFEKALEFKTRQVYFIYTGRKN